MSKQPILGAPGRLATKPATDLVVSASPVARPRRLRAGAEQNRAQGRYGNETLVHAPLKSMRLRLGQV